MITESRQSPSNPNRLSPFNSEEIHRIQQLLDQCIELEYIQFRPSAQGSVAYVEGWKALSLANETFGFNGWSSEILSLGTDFVDIENGRVSIGVSCMVRIHLRDGTYHDDIGYGSAENQKSKAAAYEKARKEAVTDAMKRALRMFGNRLGNCAYDKSFLKKARAATNKQTTNLNHPSSVNLSNKAPPQNFEPAWQRPKLPLVNSEPETELIVTEEQMLEFGTFFTDKSLDINDQSFNIKRPSEDIPQSLKPKFQHPSVYRSPVTNRAEFRTVSIPSAQFRPPNPP